MDGPPDWDLLAVVRSCTSSTTTASPPVKSTPPPPSQPPPSQPPPSVLLGYSTPLTTNTTTSFSTRWPELQEICRPLTTYSYNNSMSSLQCTSSSSIIAAVNHHQMRRGEVAKHHASSSSSSSHVIFGASSPTTTAVAATSNSQRAKKRKNLMKKVCHVPAEGLSSDMWAWRKYGQKPIKGSPYPRGYYRCSSSKGCLARKQVERNRSDPKMFIVTYTSEHNHPMPTHRNSLAGSTRQKAVTPADQPTCSSPSTSSPAANPPLTDQHPESSKADNGDEDMGGIYDLMLNDDFYVGFEQLDGGSDDSDCFSEQFSPSSSEFPWLSNGSSSTATAAGGS